MTEKEGVLQMQPSGRWAICRPGERPHELKEGDVFQIEVAGQLRSPAWSSGIFPVP
jgi:hypothetical protein